MRSFLSRPANRLRAPHTLPLGLLVVAATFATDVPRADAAPPSYVPPPVLSRWGGCEDEELMANGWCYGSEEPGEFRYPLAVAIDNDGCAYVTDAFGSRIQKFSLDGTLLAVWPQSGGTDRLAWGPDDLLWVLTSFGNRIRKLDRDGNDAGGWGVAGDGPGEFGRPTLLEFDADGNALVYDTADNRLQRYTTDGTFLGEWEVTPHFISPSRRAMAALPDGSILFADTFTGFEWFDGNGVFLGKWGVPGDGDGEFSWVGDMTVGPDGNLYVVDSGNHRVQVMTPDGSYVGQWGEKGWEPGRFITPSAIAAAQDFVLVVDLFASAVHVFTWDQLVTTDPRGFPIVVDGVEYVAPAFVRWEPGSSHVLEAMPPWETEGHRFEFANWSDGGAGTHTVVATAEPTVFTAAYDESYWLEMSGDEGVVFFPDSRWIAAGDSVEIRAIPPEGPFFVHWTGTGAGSYTGHLPVVTITPGDSVTEHAYLTEHEVPGNPVGDFTISASATDPHVHAAPPANGLRELYLWVTCVPEGLAAFEAQTTGSVTPIAFTPADNILNAGSAEHLFMAIGGCPAGSELEVLLGTWIVLDYGGDFCLTDPANGSFAFVDCNTVFPGTDDSPALIGFASVGTPCDIGEKGCPTPAAITTDVAILSAVDVFGLAPPRPNPFRDRTTFLYTLPAPSDVRVSVFDVTGRLVRRLADGRLPGGAHAVDWDGRGSDSSPAPAGVYFVRLETDGRAETRKVTRLGVR